MAGIVSTIINYYGYVHLAYYSSHLFLSPTVVVMGNKSANDSTAAEEQILPDESLYMWLSKWYSQFIRVIFISYIYVEPIVLAIFDFIPGIYFLSIMLKLKLLSSNNQWHQLFYDKTYGHLQEFDIFEFAWSFSSNRIVAIINKVLVLLSLLFPKLNSDQLNTLIESLEGAAEEARQAKCKQESRKSMRMSKLLNRSALEDFKSGKKPNKLFESEVIDAK